MTACHQDIRRIPENKQHAGEERTVAAVSTGDIGDNRPADPGSDRSSVRTTVSVMTGDTVDSPRKKVCRHSEVSVPQRKIHGYPGKDFES